MSTPTQHSTICNTPGNHMQSSPQGPNLLQDTNTLDCSTCSTGPGLHHTALICTNNHTSRMQSCVDTYSLKVASCWWGCVCLEPQHHMSQARVTSAAHTTRTQHVQYTTPHAFASHRSHQCKWHNMIKWGATVAWLRNMHCLHSHNAQGTHNNSSIPYQHNKAVGSQTQIPSQQQECTAVLPERLHQQ